MTTRGFDLIAIISVVWFVTSPLVAHPGGHSHIANDSQGSRTWTFLAEDSHLHGTFVAAKEGNVQIRRDNGLLTTVALARLVPADQQWIKNRLAEIERLNTDQASLFVVQKSRPSQNEKQQALPLPAPAMLEHFKPFEKALKLRWDEKFFYVGSNGIPDHPMMIGIRAWQQQVPLPQKYFDENAWQIPLHPVPAPEPVSAKNRFLRGAIALAVNGVPIFNSLNNRGDDAFLFGELDEYGGHCGRADDYHYHLAPVHLEKTVGKSQPIAYALDGYPVYGYQDEKSPDFAPLDALNGHKDQAGRYYYHATKTYPYLNGGFYGVVREREGQVDLQPRAEGVRPALPPLRDAKIVDFKEVKPGSFQLTYNLQGKLGTVGYTLAEDGSAKFTFMDIYGKSTTENYTPRKRPPTENERPAPKNAPPPKREDGTRTNTKPASKLPQLKLTSASLNAEGFLVADCTCDGKGQSPAIAWGDIPAGTKSFAVSLWHAAPEQEKSYWLVYNIPAEIQELKQQSAADGSLGLNDKRRAAYDPMCSKGPGVKTYHITVFALSQELKIPPESVTRAKFLAAVKDLVLAEGTLNYQYERKSEI